MNTLYAINIILVVVAVVLTARVQPAATGSKPVPVKSVLKRSNKQERDGYVESASHDGLDP